MNNWLVYTNNKLSTISKDTFSQKLKLNHNPLFPLLMERWVKFHSRQNIFRTSQHTTETDEELFLKKNTKKYKMAPRAKFIIIILFTQFFKVEIFTVAAIPG